MATPRGQYVGALLAEHRLGLAALEASADVRPVLSTPYLNIRSGAVAFSSEPGNLMNLHSYKYSGLANSKTVHIGQATKKSGHATAVLALKMSSICDGKASYSSDSATSVTSAAAVTVQLLLC
eukprot:4288-Heterococcus_DN1.PRE.5